MRLFGAFINNTFLIWLLLVVVTLYIAFSNSIKKDHGLVETSSKHEMAIAPTEPDQITEKIEAKVESPADTHAEEQAPKATGTSSQQLPDEKQEKSGQASSQKQDNIVPTSQSVDNQPTQGKETEQIQTTKEEKPVATVQKQVNATLKQPTMQASQSSTVDETVQEKKHSSQAVPQLLSKEEAKKLLKTFASPKDAMDAALKAYHLQDYAQAEKILYALSLWQPSPDILGALGNVFYKDNQLDWAKRAWAAAVNVLIQRGEFKAVHNYAEQLKTVAPDLAQQIKQKVQQVEK